MSSIEGHFHPGEFLCGFFDLLGGLREDFIHLGHGLPFIDDRRKLLIGLLVLQVDVLVLLLHRHVLLEGKSFLLSRVRRSGQSLRVEAIYPSLFLGLMVLSVLDELHYPIVFL